MKKVLVYLISGFILLYADSISFKDLTKMVSRDIKTNIYLDKDIKDYSVDINLVDHQQAGQLYEFYKIVLFSHDFRLQYNKAGDFYYVKQYKKTVEPAVLPPKPVPFESDKLHYFTYKIRNITNNDVIACMSVFPNVKYKYLKQSDIIAYSSTLSDHKQIVKILTTADNSVKHRTVKLTLFSINKKKFLSYGSSFRVFQYDFDSTLDGVFSAFRSGGSNSFTLNDSVSLDFTLYALKGHRLADILQEPVMILTNGVKSSVTSVMNVPYLKTTSTVDSTTNSVTEQYEYKDIGLQISVTPKIKDDWVYLDLSLISEELISLDDNKPTTQKITYKNTVKVTKGHPILLTGINKTTKQIVKHGIPLLSDIPVLGELFKSKSVNTDNQNFNILIEVL
ncbi:MAG: hypothetical protein P794_05055 [Epsilonproteobacteria bacterium (ex Lamellibrachia satsuma)]|nr:MAG: hypothetical protein P794_05055 [Epsilonproteobacteria bacterium (ex Lamellibrachia satsuma)]